MRNIKNQNHRLGGLKDSTEKKSVPSEQTAKIRDSDKWEIPSDWEVKHFEDIADIDKESLNGNTPKDYVFDYISLSDVDDDFRIEATRQVFSTAPSRARRIVKKGDVLMSTVRPNLQGFSLIKNDVKDLIASTGFAVITTNKCSNEFLYHYLFSSAISKQFYQLLVGSNYPAINSSDVRKLEILLPPFPEQTAIAQLLSTWDNAIAKTQALIAKKELYKKWLMQNLLTGKKRLKGFDKDWKEYRIEELFEKVFRYVEWNDESLYKLVSLRRRYGGLFERGDYLGSQIEVKKIKSISHKDFLISKRQVSHGAWGVVALEFHDRKVSDEYDSLIVKDNNKLLIEFWDWFSKIPLLSHYAFLASNGVHIEKLIFDFDTFKRRRVLIPPTTEEQTAIALVLQCADTEIQILKTKLEKLKEQKKGLMQVLLTGEKRLKL